MCSFLYAILLKPAFFLQYYGASLAGAGAMPPGHPAYLRGPAMPPQPPHGLYSTSMQPQPQYAFRPAQVYTPYPQAGGYTVPSSAAYFPMSVYSTPMGAPQQSRILEAMAMEPSEGGFTQPNTPDLLMHRRQVRTYSIATYPDRFAYL